MMKLRATTIGFVALSTAAALALPGCKSPEEAACANMIEILKRERPEAAEGDNGDIELCIDKLRHGDCADRKRAIDCLADAPDGAALQACSKHCQ